MHTPTHTQARNKTWYCDFFLVLVPVVVAVPISVLVPGSQGNGKYRIPGVLSIAISRAQTRQIFQMNDTKRNKTTITGIVASEV